MIPQIFELLKQISIVSNSPNTSNGSKTTNTCRGQSNMQLSENSKQMDQHTESMIIPVSRQSGIEALAGLACKHMRRGWRREATVEIGGTLPSLLLVHPHGAQEYASKATAQVLWRDNITESVETLHSFRDNGLITI